MRLSASQMEQRRLDMYASAFALFSERGIESTSIHEVADATGFGEASIYRYFGDKTTLVIETAAWKWREYLEAVNAEYARRNGPSMCALEEFEFYLDSYLMLYRDHPDLLRFNARFDLYVQREEVTEDRLAPYTKSVDLFLEKFRTVRRKALADQTMRTDIDEEELFYTTMYSMLTLAAKFSFGLIYPASSDFDRERALLRQKQMLMEYVLPERTAEEEGGPEDGHRE